MFVCAVSSDPTSSLPLEQIHQTSGQTGCELLLLVTYAFLEPHSYALLNMSIFISISHVNLVTRTPALTSYPPRTVFVLPDIKTESLLLCVDYDADWP